MYGEREREEEFLGQQPDLIAATPQLTPNDTRSLLSSFTHDQLLSVVQSTPLRHPDVLSAFRTSGIRDQIASLLCSLPPLRNPRPLKAAKEMKINL